ncbi:MAG: hypothetical protein Q8O00_11080 [Holophaga sp.]|nr:hypothetical protein [Holophaga sp.]
MMISPLAILFSSVLMAAPPLHVAAVVRSGMPPYEDAKSYRLEGAGCLTLRVGEQLTLQRTDERRRLGRLQVLAIKSDYALARIVEEGETYPLKGDLVVRHEEALRLPTLPPPPVTPEPLTVVLKAPTSVMVLNPPRELHKEAIFFLRDSAEVSPGARNKLALWVKAWGSDGRWVVGCPEGLPQKLQKDRAERLVAELERLGVTGVVIRNLQASDAGRYDSIFLSLETR